MIDPKVLVEVLTNSREGTDRSRMVEYLEYDGKRVAEVSLSVPKAEREFLWSRIWHDIIHAPRG